MCCPSRVQIFLCQTHFRGRKGACVSELEFLGAGTNPFWCWDLEHTHTKGLLTQLLLQPLPKPGGRLSSTWNSSRGLELPYQGNLKWAQVDLSGWKLQWFRISFMYNSPRSEKAPSEKVPGGSYWFCHLPLISSYWCPNTIGIKYGSGLNLGLVLKDRWNLELDPCKAPYFPLCQLTFQFWCASWNASPFHIYHGLKFAAVWDVWGSSGWVGPTTAISGVLCSKTALRTEQGWSRSFPTPCMLKHQYFGTKFDHIKMHLWKIS